MTPAQPGPYNRAVPTDLAGLLVEEGAVAADAMDRALVRQRAAGGALDTALLELGYVREADLVGALSRASGLPAAAPEVWEAPDARARRVFPSRVAERHGLAPFALDGRELALVATYPVDLVLLDEISFMLSLHLTAHVGPEWRVRALIHRLYGTPLPARLAALASAERPGAEAAGSAATGPVVAVEPPALLEVAPGVHLAPAAPAVEPGEPIVEALARALEAELFPGEPAAPRDLDQDAPAEPPVMEPPPEPPPAPAAAPGPDRSAPPGWSLAEARAAVDAARDRDEAVLAALRYARDFFEFAALFAVARDAVAGHDALGPEGDDARDLCRAVALYASDPGVFHAALETRAPQLGPVPRDVAGNLAVLEGLGRGAPHAALVYPVLVRDRPVCVLYADDGERPVSRERIADLLVLLGELGGAFERLIHDRKRRRSEESDEPAPPVRASPAARAAPPPPGPARASAAPFLAPPPPDAPFRPRPPAARPPPPPPPPRERDPWEATEPGSALRDLEVDVDLELEAWPTADALLDAAAPRRFDPESAVTELLATGAGSAERALAIAVLAEHPAESLPVLWARLPGPLESDADDAAPEALGPLPAALAALGAPAVPAMLDVLRDPDPDRRRVAAAVLGANGDPAAFPALADRALDPQPRVAAAAAAALGAHRRHPAMRPVPEKLRRALLSGLSGRAACAARALGALRDAEAVPLLVQALDSPEREPAEAAAEALSRITLQRIGPDAHRWIAWWRQNRGRGRAEWLLSGLTSAEREVRVAAAAELSGAAPAPVAYSADAPAADRERAARAWAGWWARSGQVL